MSKKMTPCEKLGYKVGDKFEMLVSKHGWEAGEVVKLVRDDGSRSPEFEGVTIHNRRYDDNRMFLCIDGSGVDVMPIRTMLRPAKQVLADAIHQNGGWVDEGRFAAQDRDGEIFFYTEKPEYSTGNGVWTHRHVIGGHCVVAKVVKNFHQAIISRDEYFTAYPDQVMVEVNNETKHKAEAEMKSESEVTIKVSDWHKNGELPPVGEVCEAHIDYPPQWIETEIVAHKDGFAIGWCNSVMKGCHGDKSHEFRPLRTERDKAIDEMAREMTEDKEPTIYITKAAAKLYEAGYRKEVK